MNKLFLENSTVPSSTKKFLSLSPFTLIKPGLKNVIKEIWSFKIPISPSNEGITASLVSVFNIVLSGDIISIVKFSDIVI